MKRFLTIACMGAALMLASSVASAGSVLFTFDGYVDYSYSDSNGGYECGTDDATIELCVYFDDVDYDEGSYWFFGTWEWWALDATGEIQSITSPLTVAAGEGTGYPSLYVVNDNFAEVVGGGLSLNGSAIEDGFAGYANLDVESGGDPGWSYDFEIAGAIDSLLGLNNFIASESLYYHDGGYWAYAELLYCLELTNVEFCADCTPPVDENVVPEPATMTLLGLGLGGLAIRRFRRA